MPQITILSRAYAFMSGIYNEVLMSIRDYFSQEPQLPIFNNLACAFIVSRLFDFLQLMPDSPFKTHPKTVNVAIASLIMYGISCDAEERFTHMNRVHINIARHGRILFSTLLVASLTSILVPSFIQPIVLLVYVGYIVFYGHEWIYWLYKRIMDEVGPIDTL